MMTSSVPLASPSPLGSNSKSNALGHGEMVSLDESSFPALELNNRRLSVKNSFCRKNGIYTRYQRLCQYSRRKDLVRGEGPNLGRAVLLSCAKHFPFLNGISELPCLSRGPRQDPAPAPCTTLMRTSPNTTTSSQRRAAASRRSPRKSLTRR